MVIVVSLYNNGHNKGLLFAGDFFYFTASRKKQGPPRSGRPSILTYKTYMKTLMNTCLKFDAVTQVDIVIIDIAVLVVYLQDHEG